MFLLLEGTTGSSERIHKKLWGGKNQADKSQGCWEDSPYIFLCFLAFESCECITFQNINLKMQCKEMKIIFTKIIP